MVIRVGYFCTSGHTEAGGMHQFLQQLRPDIEWHRCFPAFDKPGPKLRKHTICQTGTTGQTLIDLMLERLEKFYRGHDCFFDLVLLIDDADCRLLDPEQRLATRISALTKEVQEKTRNANLQFIALLASPEIESWLLADWDEGFGKQYQPIAHELRALLQSEQYLSPAPWTDIENYGGPYRSESHCCTNKLSEVLIGGALAELAMRATAKTSHSNNGDYDPSAYQYSKKVHGPAMLRRVRADKIALVCTQYFRKSYQALLNLQPVPTPPTPSAAESAPPQTQMKRRRRK